MALTVAVGLVLSALLGTSIAGTQATYGRNLASAELEPTREGGAAALSGRLDKVTVLYTRTCVGWVEKGGKSAKLGVTLRVTSKVEDRKYSIGKRASLTIFDNRPEGAGEIVVGGMLDTIDDKPGFRRAIWPAKEYFARGIKVKAGGSQGIDLTLPGVARKVGFFGDLAIDIKDGDGRYIGGCEARAFNRSKRGFRIDAEGLGLRPSS